MLVRPATESDLTAVIEIENREIAHNFAHFGQTPVTLEQSQVSLRAAKGKYPWFVAEDDGAIIGFARCGPWKARESYRFTTEIGVYVLPEHHRKGIGKKLYEALFPAMRECGFRTVIAGIAQPNIPSNRLHELFGMQFVGMLPDVGFKHGKWISVGYWVLHWPD